MAQHQPFREPVVREGQLIGHAEADYLVGRGGRVTMALRFRPNWPGLWHAMALRLDRAALAGGD
jgi:hypothetical protein